jgi:multidrug transporter EmrE-like cation transporter
MKLSNGGQDKTYLTLGGIAYAASFVFLTLALKYLPMGLTNAIWAGASTFVVYMIGVFYFKDETSIMEIFFVFCIILGIVGLNFTSKPEELL